MRTFFKWLFATAGILIVGFVLVMGFAIWGSYETGKRLDIGYGTSTSPRLVRLEIGDKVFAIPQNHIWSREDWKGGKTPGVNMYALLPDFSPRTKSNEHIFDNPRSKRKIRLLLLEHAIPGSRTTSTSMTRQEIYQRKIHGVFSEGKYFPERKRVIEDYPGPHGLVIRQLRPPLVTDDDMYIAHKRDGSFYWVTCSPEGKHVNPGCRTNIEYSKHVTISYSFPKGDLSEWETIDKRVIKFIHQFEHHEKQGTH